MIKVDSIVDVHFVNGDLLFGYKVLHKPCATGDCWELLSKDGRQVNVMNFESMHEVIND